MKLYRQVCQSPGKKMNLQKKKKKEEIGKNQFHLATHRNLPTSWNFFPPTNQWLYHIQYAGQIKKCAHDINKIGQAVFEIPGNYISQSKTVEKYSLFKQEPISHKILFS